MVTVRRRAFSFAVVLAAWILVAPLGCKEEEARPPPGDDSTTLPGRGSGAAGGGVDAAEQDGGAVPEAGADAAGGCNDVVLGGGLIEQNRLASDAPIAQGGIVADGTY